MERAIAGAVVALGAIFLLPAVHTAWALVTGRRTYAKTWAILAACCGAIILGNAPGIVAEAGAAIDCEHRSAKHVAEHGGIDADSAWHVSHGQRPTCKDEQPAERHDDGRRESDDNERDDGPAIHHRDEPGIHCRFLVMCG